MEAQALSLAPQQGRAQAMPTHLRQRPGWRQHCPLVATLDLTDRAPQCLPPCPTRSDRPHLIPTRREVGTYD